MDAGERALEGLDPIRQHRNADRARCERVGTDRKRIDLRCEARNRAGKESVAGENRHRLVAAAHARGAATGQDDARRAHRASSPFRAATLST